MKILLYDPFAGISGDMNIGAMVSLGIPESYFIDIVKQLRLPGAAVSFRTEQRKGINGIRAIVTDAEEHGNRHAHHDERNLDDIRKIIEKSTLDSNTKELSMRMFMQLAEAEAKVHGKAVDEVHFHETGAVDSIIDIVCSAAAVEYLRPDLIVSKPVELGSGMIQCEHGILPVPAPATAEIVRNIPVTSGRTDHEATTPTGAVIIKTLAEEFSEDMSFRIIKTGYGVGSRDGKIPNVLRVMLAEVSSQKPQEDEAVIINCNIDDMNPEIYGNVMDKLFAAGAKEVFITPVYMKKSRPGILLTVMCSNGLEKALKEVIFHETTTAGLRSYNVRQEMLEREYTTAETSYGSLKIKKLYHDGKCISEKPEYEEMARIARKNNIPLRQLYREISRCL